VALVFLAIEGEAVHDSLRTPKALDGLFMQAPSLLAQMHFAHLNFVLK
jgi:hypothetical protein